MINRNSIDGVINVRNKFLNSKQTLFYDVTSKIPLGTYLSLNHNSNNITEILISIYEIIKNTSRYYLYENNFYIDKDYIFINVKNKNTYLMYLPIKTKTDNLNNYKQICYDFIGYNSSEIFGYKTYQEIVGFLKKYNIRNEKPLRNITIETRKTKSIKNNNFKKRIDKFIKNIKHNINKISHNPVIDIEEPNIYKPNESYSFKENYFCVSESEALSYETVLLTDKKALIVLDGQKYHLDKEKNIIGRMPESDVLINNSNVGNIHAEIFKDNNEFFIIDHNSKNGTYLNGVRIKSETKYILKNNDKICLADCKGNFIVY